MVFVSKEPQLFGGNIKLAILIDGEEAEAAVISPEEAPEWERKMLNGLVYNYVKYMLKHAPNRRHTDIVDIRQTMESRRYMVCEAIAKKLRLLENHLPQRSKHANACRVKLRQVREMVQHYEQLKETA